MRWFADVCRLCPLTAETEKLIDADALGCMKPSACLINAAGAWSTSRRSSTRSRDGRSGARARRHGRGTALRDLAAVGDGERTAGETCRYEDNVLAIMQENLARLWRGETELLNRGETTFHVPTSAVSFPGTLRITMVS